MKYYRLTVKRNGRTILRLRFPDLSSALRLARVYREAGTVHLSRCNA